MAVLTKAELGNRYSATARIKRPHFLKRYVKMQFAESDIVQLASDIWSSVLGLNVERSTGAAQLAPADRLTSCVQIAGAWQGSVTLDTTRSFAIAAAAAMFDKPVDEVSEDDIVDALAELTNMLGGNIKSILPGPSFLALPTVTEGLDYSLSIPGARRLSEIPLDCGEHPVCIQLFEHDRIESSFSPLG